MSERAVDDAGRLLSRRVGLRLDPAIRGRLERAVRDEAERVGVDPGSYVASLEGDADRLQELLNRVTVQETSFFRDPGQFAALATWVLPALRMSGERVHIWSAGCANGQEPYSLAMALAESGIERWQVTATDISTSALARTRAARYSEKELRGLSDERRHAFLVPGGDGAWSITPELRDNVQVLRHNLASDPPPFLAGACQVVFCRNVLIYFGHDDVVSFLDRLAARLAPSGHLFLGYSESLWQVTDRFKLVRLGDAFAYRPATPGPAPTPPAPVPPARATPPAAPRKPRAQRAPRPAPPPPDPATVPSPSEVVELMASGEAALDRGEHAEAIAAFRKATFVDPDHPLAHLSLGIALEAAGDDAAARRAFAASRAALDRCDAAAVEATLEGYRLDDLVALLDRKAATS